MAARGEEDIEAAALLQVNEDDEIQTTLEFQTFDMGSTPASKSTYAPQRTASTQGSEWAAPADSERSASSERSSAFYSLDYYMKFFDVDTDQVLGRMLRSLTPWPANFFEVLSPNPDLYGPFWIATTVIFVLFVSGNISGSIYAFLNQTEFEPDFSQLSLAATSIYSYVFITPLVLYFAFHFYSIPVKLLELWCLYGYAMSVYIPISIICVIPLDSVKWGLSIYALVSSGAFMTVNLWPVATGVDRKMGYTLIIIMLLLHTGMTLLFKFVFFTYSGAVLSDTPTSAPTTAPEPTEAAPTVAVLASLINATASPAS